MRNLLWLTQRLATSISPKFPLYYVPYDPSEKESLIIKQYPSGFRIGSRLLVTQGSFTGRGIFFYNWEKNRFVLIRSVGDDEKH